MYLIALNKLDSYLYVPFTCTLVKLKLLSHLFTFYFFYFLSNLFAYKTESQFFDLFWWSMYVSTNLGNRIKATSLLSLTIFLIFQFSWTVTSLNLISNLWAGAQVLHCGSIHKPCGYGRGRRASQMPILHKPYSLRLNRL